MKDPVWLVLASQDPSGDEPVHLHLARSADSHPVGAQFRSAELEEHVIGPVYPPVPAGRDLGVITELSVDDPPQAWVTLELAQLLREESIIPAIAAEAATRLIRLTQGAESEEIHGCDDTGGNTWMWLYRGNALGRCVYPCEASTVELNAALEEPSIHLRAGKKLPEGVRRLLGHAVRVINAEYTFGGLIEDASTVALLNGLRHLSLCSMPGINPAGVLYDNLVELCEVVSWRTWEALPRQ